MKHDYEPTTSDGVSPMSGNARRERLRQASLDLQIKSLEELSAQTEAARRSVDLQTAAGRAAALDPEPPLAYWFESLAAILYVPFHSIITRIAPRECGAVVHNVLFQLGIPSEGITADQAQDAGVAIVGMLLIATICVVRLFIRQRRQTAKRCAVGALRRVREIYCRLSDRFSSLRRDGHLRTQSEARLVAFSGMGWDEISAADGSLLVQDHLCQLADLDARRSLDEQEYAAAGGMAFLDLLRATIHGEFPLALCLYGAAGIGTDGEVPPIRRWRRRAVRLCRAERRLEATASARRDQAYRCLEHRLRMLTAFSAAELLTMLRWWSSRTGGANLRSDVYRRSFDFAFRGHE